MNKNQSEFGYAQLENMGYTPDKYASDLKGFLSFDAGLIEKHPGVYATIMAPLAYTASSLGNYIRDNPESVQDNLEFAVGFTVLYALATIGLDKYLKRREGKTQETEAANPTSKKEDKE
ncbi:MAG: hypothetical protein JW727_03835 [Candidatus Aenigmarchaeota archaeon]|nr:hypothetical protein [Candidatus Aenigmarchaeota archaeon]